MYNVMELDELKLTAGAEKFDKTLGDKALLNH